MLLLYYSLTYHASYIGVLIDLWIVVQHGWIQGNDIILPYTVSFLVIKVKQKVLLGNTHVHGSAGKPHCFLYDTVCNERGQKLRNQVKNNYCLHLKSNIYTCTSSEKFSA